MYSSTRCKKNITASKAIIEGISDDGGLYIIKEIPKIDYKSLYGKTYKEIAKVILKSLLPDYTDDELDYCINSAYNTKFDTSEVVNVKRINNYHYLELYHGPTLAFKDVALTILPYLLEVAKEKNNVKEKTTILTATSGDTGSAALSGFKSVNGIDIIVFYPNGGVSKIQEQQMLSFESNSAKTFAIAGNFDDCQTFVKKVFSEDFKGLSSANSINVGRLVPQVVYYFYAYNKLVEDKTINMGDKINFCVPTGNFGDILAGYYAKEMGLPINKLICASNINKVLADFFNTKVYDKKREFLKTISPSMDILISSNLERLLYFKSKDENVVKKYMDDLKTKGEFKVSEDYSEFYGNYASDKEALEVIKKEFDNNSYLIDPHTAGAKAVYDKYVSETNDLTQTVILSTASPYKFIKSISSALDLDSNLDEFDLIDMVSKKSKTNIPNVITEIRKNIRTNHPKTLDEAHKYLEENLLRK